MGRMSVLAAGTVLLYTLAGCAHQSGNTLYQDLGGQDGLARIADAFIERLADDPRVVEAFADTDIAEFRRLLIEQFCELSGGPCTYSGRTMTEAHRGLGITPAQFDALVEDLIGALEDAGTPQGARNRLLGKLAPFHDDVVERH